jgi:hypothetical protein
MDRQGNDRNVATIKVKLSDSWMSMEVDILSLRRALGLPDHKYFS